MRSAIEPDLSIKKIIDDGELRVIGQLYGFISDIIILIIYLFLLLATGVVS